MPSRKSSQNGPAWRAVLPYIRAGHTIIGIDEVGRGAWCGPVVAAAVILQPRSRLTGVRDSKQLTADGRRQADRLIRRRALAVGIGWVGSSELDTYGLSWAVRESGLRALEQLGFELATTTATTIVLDGKHNYLANTHPSVAFPRADATILPVAAASVVAKVARDRYMAMLARQLPGYDLHLHKGYGTAAHRQALEQLGPTQHHRQSYAPLKAYNPAELETSNAVTD
jgi:ribonuclease HII